MCCLVTGGKGSSRRPNSTGAGAGSSLLVSCEVMVDVADMRGKNEVVLGHVLGEVVPPLLCESSFSYGNFWRGKCGAAVTKAWASPPRNSANQLLVALTYHTFTTPPPTSISAHQ
jgi:hypothetical protein